MRQRNIDQPGVIQQNAVRSTLSRTTSWLGTAQPVREPADRCDVRSVEEILCGSDQQTAQTGQRESTMCRIEWHVGWLWLSVQCGAVWCGVVWCCVVLLCGVSGLTL